MNNAIKQIKKTINKVTGYLPTSLPLGMTEFKSWSDSIIETYDLPDNDSSRWALAVMISHLDPTTAVKPKIYFSLSVKKSMANQIAFAVMEGLKAKQKAEQEAAQKAESAKQVEATTISVVDNEQRQSI